MMDEFIEVLKALADENRLKIINLLLTNEFCVGALVSFLGISKAAVSQHIQILRKAGLLDGEKRGYWIHYSVKRDLLNNVAGFSFKEMSLVIPPVFVLLGLLDVWVPRETMMKFMGENSGLKGILLAIILGSAAAGPLYGAFPIAAVFMKKGVKFSNILIFIGAWSTTKIPMFLFEMSALGSKFALTRLIIDIPGIIIIAFILESIISKDTVKKIYENAELNL